MKKEHIYENLKAFRLDRGMTQKDLALKLGYSSWSNIGVMERNGDFNDSFKKKFQKQFGHFDYKVKGVNIGPYPEKTELDIELENDKKALQQIESLERKLAREELKVVEIKPDKPEIGDYVLDGGSLNLKANPEVKRSFDKVYLVLEGDFIKGFKEKEKAALYAWKLAMQEEDCRIYEVEVE